MILETLPNRQGYSSLLAFKLLHKHRILSKGSQKGSSQSLHLDYLVPHYYENSKKPTFVDLYGTTLSMPTEHKPVFTQRLRSRVIQESNHVKLTCQVEGIPTPTVVWLKGRNELTAGDPHVEIHTSHGTCMLEIVNCNMGDMAEYICRAENAHGVDETSSFVFVERHGKKSKESAQPLGIVDFDLAPIRRSSMRPHDQTSEEIRSKTTKRKEVTFTPSIVDELQGLTVYEGATIMLQCRVDGKPVPTAQWTCNNIDLSVSDNVEINGDSDCPTLIIRGVSLENAGEYSCTVTNAVGSATTSADVIVKPVPGGVPANLEAADVEQETEGERKLSNAVPQVREDSNSIEAESQRDDISGRAVDDDITLDVEVAGIDKIAGTTEKIVRQDETQSAEQVEDEAKGTPSVGILILRHLNGMVISEGEPLKLECEIEAIPGEVCEATWIRNGKVIPENPDFVRSQTGTKYTLEVAEMFAEDSGSFGVQLECGDSTATSACSVVVLGDEEIDPSIVEFPQSVTVHEGAPVEFTCRVAGSQPLTVSWHTFEGSALELSGNCDISGPDSEGRCVLAIKNANVENDGMYQMTVSNEESELTIVFTLQVVTDMD